MSIRTFAKAVAFLAVGASAYTLVIKVVAPGVYVLLETKVAPAIIAAYPTPYEVKNIPCEISEGVPKPAVEMADFDGTEFMLDVNQCWLTVHMPPDFRAWNSVPMMLDFDYYIRDSNSNMTSFLNQETKRYTLTQKFAIQSSKDGKKVKFWKLP